MDCCRFVELINDLNCKVAIFGAGDYGTTWCYALLVDAGFDIDCYIDNYKVGSKCNGLHVYGIEYLRLHPEIFVFVSTRGDAGREIVSQLNELDIAGYYYFDSDYAPAEFAEYLDERGDEKLISRFPSVMDDERYLEILFRYRCGYDPVISNPQTFNEKIQYLKLHDRNPLYTKLADKSLVKDYVSCKIGATHVIPTIFTCNNANEIDFDKLPRQFVLKCTHDGGVIICKDKYEFDYYSSVRRLNERLKVNYYWLGREWCYRDIVPKIICEPYLTDESGVELKDYKVFCFWGKPELIQVDYDRFGNHRRNLYTIGWEYVDGRIEYPTDKSYVIKKPNVLEELLEYASILSADIPHVRTDFYICDSNIYLGEMTFYHGNGCERFYPESLGKFLGDKIDLDKVWDKR